MSLKDGMDINPNEITEYLDAVEAVKKGKKGALERLAEYVDKRMISSEEYERLAKIYNEKKEKAILQKIKSILWATLSIVIIFFSVSATLLYLAPDKSLMFWYIILCFCVLGNDLSEKGKRISYLENENEQLKEKIDFYKRNNFQKEQQ